MNNTMINNTTTEINNTTTGLRLTKHFCLSEFTRSATAIRYGISNQPSEQQVQRLQALCQQVLEPLRRRFGVIRITSGYRSPELNVRVGGVPNSQHTLGEAADIHTGGKETSEKMYHYIRTHLPYDQLILERRPGVYWLHVSFRSDRPGNRYQAFMQRK